MKARVVLLVMLVGLLMGTWLWLRGCGSEPSIPIPSPTATIAPTASPTETPSPTMQPTATTVPTASPTETPSPTLPPTATAVPTQTPLPTPLPLPTLPVHVVEAGETLTHIALSYYGCAYGQPPQWWTLCQANPEIRQCHLIYVGQEIALPAGSGCK